MSDKPEPLAAVLAEMRASSLSTVRAWADRIDAAAEREREKAKDLSKELDGNRAITGNAAAMRESIETMRRYAMLPQEELSLSLLQRTIHEKCDDALSAPARNCDISRDTKETIERCLASLNVESSSASFDAGVCAAIGWMLSAPAKGGDHA